MNKGLRLCECPSHPIVKVWVRKKDLMNKGLRAHSIEPILELFIQ